MRGQLFGKNAASDIEKARFCTNSSLLENCAKYGLDPEPEPKLFQRRNQNRKKIITVLQHCLGGCEWLKTKIITASQKICMNSSEYSWNFLQRVWKGIEPSRCIKQKLWKIFLYQTIEPVGWLLHFFRHFLLPIFLSLHLLSGHCGDSEFSALKLSQHKIRSRPQKPTTVLA